jgi:uncharacterized alkaline shock family protein YloU
MILFGAAFAVLFTAGLGILTVLIGAGFPALADVTRFVGSPSGEALLFALGSVLILLGLYFAVLLSHARAAHRRFAQDGPGGRIELSPFALREFVNGILRQEIGIERFGVRLRHREEGIAIRIQTTLSPDQQVAEVARRIQETLTRRVAERTGVTVQEVSVLVNSIRPREQGTDPQPPEKEPMTDDLDA